MILGSSNARALTRGKNFETLQQSMQDEQFASLAVGGGAGIVPNLVNLNVFYDFGNSVEQIVLLVHPVMFLSEGRNYEHEYADREPFSYSLFWRLLTNGVSVQRLRSYLAGC